MNRVNTKLTREKLAMHRMLNFIQVQLSCCSLRVCSSQNLRTQAQLFSFDYREREKHWLALPVPGTTTTSPVRAWILAKMVKRVRKVNPVRVLTSSLLITEGGARQAEERYPQLSYIMLSHSLSSEWELSPYSWRLLEIGWILRPLKQHSLSPLVSLCTFP